MWVFHPGDIPKSAYRWQPYPDVEAHQAVPDGYVHEVEHVERGPERRAHRPPGPCQTTRYPTLCQAERPNIHHYARPSDPIFTAKPGQTTQSSAHMFPWRINCQHLSRLQQSHALIPATAQLPAPSRHYLMDDMTRVDSSSGVRPSIPIRLRSQTQTQALGVRRWAQTQASGSESSSEVTAGLASARLRCSGTKHIKLRCDGCPGLASGGWSSAGCKAVPLMSSTGCLCISAHPPPRPYPPAPP